MLKWNITTSKIKLYSLEGFKFCQCMFPKSWLKSFFLLRLRAERFFLLFFCMTESLQIINRHRGSLLKILEKKSAFWESCTNACHDLRCSWPILYARYHQDDFSHALPPVPIFINSHSSFNPSISQTVLCKTSETQETFKWIFLLKKFGKYFMRYLLPENRKYSLGQNVQVLERQAKRGRFYSASNERSIEAFKHGRDRINCFMENV